MKLDGPYSELAGKGTPMSACLPLPLPLPLPLTLTLTITLLLPLPLPLPLYRQDPAMRSCLEASPTLSLAQCALRAALLSVELMRGLTEVRARA